MGEGAAPGEPFEALVDARSVLTLAEGLGARFHQVVSPRGAAQSWPWRAAAVASGLVDLAKARTLARDQDAHIVARLLCDGLDLVIWCVAARDDTDTSEDSVIPGVALAAEAGGRYGPAGLAVPMANLLVASAVRRARGHRIRPEQVSWQLMGTAGGWMLSTFSRRRLDAARRLHDAGLEARCQRAELAGLHDAVTEHAGAIDELQRASVLVDLATESPGPSTNLIGAFKAEVAGAARAQATYLREAVLGWQRRTNLRPALARSVTVDLAPEDGTVLLSEHQTRRLHDRLDSLDLSGPVSVRPVDRVECRRPEGDRDLLVGAELVRLPGDHPAQAWRFDAVPTAFLMNVGWLVQPTGGHREAVAWRATLPPLALNTAAMLWSARQADAEGMASPGAAVASAFATTLLYTVSSSRAMRNPHAADGSSRFPWALPLQGYELVRTTVSGSLGRRGRVVAGVGTVAVVGIGWWLAPRPRSARAAVAELGWVVAFDAFSGRLRRGIDDAASRFARSIEADDDDRLGEAYVRGQERGWEAVAVAMARSRARFDERAATLEPALRTEIEARFRSVEAMTASSRAGARATAL